MESKGKTTSSHGGEDPTRGIDAAIRAIQADGDEIRKVPGVVDIRPGYRFQDGWITDEPAVVATVLPEVLSDPARTSAIPKSIGGVPVDIAPASPAEQLKVRGGTAGERAVGLPEAAAPEEALALPGWDRATPASRAVAPEERAPRKPYKAPPGLTLDEVKAAMTLTCHASPDAGFPTLGAFLEGTKHRLTVAMYDLTAPQVVKALLAGMKKADGELDLNLDPGLSLSSGGDKDNPKANDITEDQVKDELAKALGERFKFTWAAVRHEGKVEEGIFPSAYHIKVAVRDGAAFWLSSGNWQSSNQPDIDPIDKASDRPGVFGKYNREWHVIVEHPGLAKLYERFIHWDMEQARPLQSPGGRGVEEGPLPDLLVPVDVEERAAQRFFAPKKFAFTAAKPLRIQPVLTPDNYADLVLELIESAEKSLYFQNQYIHINQKNAPGFTKLVDGLLGKMNDGLDVRVILRDIGSPRAMLEALQYRGFDMSKVKLQKGCHNKGIVVDSQVVALGSHNWSSDGTTANRDATLIIHDPGVAGYYEEIFRFDWDNLAHQRASKGGRVPVLAGPGAERAVGMVRIPWASYFED